MYECICQALAEKVGVEFEDWDEACQNKTLESEVLKVVQAEGRKGTCPLGQPYQIKHLSVENNSGH